MRGFFTNPSRADDCFIPFSSGLRLVAHVSGTVTSKYGTVKPNWIVDDPNSVTANGNVLTFTKSGSCIFYLVCTQNSYANLGTEDWVYVTFGGNTIKCIDIPSIHEVSTGEQITEVAIHDAHGVGVYNNSVIGYAYIYMA